MLYDRYFHINYRTNEWFIVHHTDCGLEKFSNEDIDKKFNIQSKDKMIG